MPAQVPDVPDPVRDQREGDDDQAGRRGGTPASTITKDKGIQAHAIHPERPATMVRHRPGPGLAERPAESGKGPCWATRTAPGVDPTVAAVSSADNPSAARNTRISRCVSGSSSSNRRSSPAARRAVRAARAPRSCRPSREHRRRDPSGCGWPPCARRSPCARRRRRRTPGTACSRTGSRAGPSAPRDTPPARRRPPPATGSTVRVGHGSSAPRTAAPLPAAAPPPHGPRPPRPGPARPCAARRSAAWNRRRPRGTPRASHRQPATAPARRSARACPSHRSAPPRRGKWAAAARRVEALGHGSTLAPSPVRTDQENPGDQVRDAPPRSRGSTGRARSTAVIRPVSEPPLERGCRPAEAPQPPAVRRSWPCAGPGARPIGRPRYRPLSGANPNCR